MFWNFQNVCFSCEAYNAHFEEKYAEYNSMKERLWSILYDCAQSLKKTNEITHDEAHPYTHNCECASL